MYVLTHNDQVLLGPMAWNSRMFNYVIEDDLDIKTNILPSDVNNTPLNLGNGIMVRACIDNYPMLNPKLQMFDGPFWTFTPTTGLASYVVVDKPVSLIQQELTAVLANERWTREQSGTTVVIQGQSVTVDTARGSRDIFVHQYLLMAPDATLMWKFPEGWLTVTKADLGVCVAAGVAHVQAAFVWEESIALQIMAATTHQELDAIQVVV